MAANCLQRLGAKYLVLIDDVYSDLFTGKPTRPTRLDADAWKRLIETTHKIAYLAKSRFGLALVFHPHAETHVEYEDQIELFLEQTDPARVSLCLDTGHHAYRGGDPVAFMRKHHKRITYLHFKSIDGTVMQKKVTAEKIPLRARRRHGHVSMSPRRARWISRLFAMCSARLATAVGQRLIARIYPAPFEKPLPTGEAHSRLSSRNWNRLTLNMIRELGKARELKAELKSDKPFITARQLALSDSAVAEIFRPRGV